MKAILHFLKKPTFAVFVCSVPDNHNTFMIPMALLSELRNKNIPTPAMPCDNTGFLFGQHNVEAGYQGNTVSSNEKILRLNRYIHHICGETSANVLLIPITYKNTG